VLVASILFVVLGVSLILFWFINRSSPSTQSSGQSSTVSQVLKAESVCSGELISEANAPITNSDQVSLGVVVNKITALKDYDHDPNCLYIVLQYALASGNATQSSNYMAKLQQLYDPAIGYNKAFTINMMSLATLNQSVSFLVQNAKSSAANSAQLDGSTGSGSETADKMNAGQK